MSEKRSGILERIIECSNFLNKEQIKQFTCPQCGYYPLDWWKTVNLSKRRVECPEWLECPKCKWNNKPDSVKDMEDK